MMFRAAWTRAPRTNQGKHIYRPMPPTKPKSKAWLALHEAHLIISHEQIPHQPVKMPTARDPNSQPTSMKFLGYDRTTKVYKYRDDKDGSVWQAHRKKLYGELKPYGYRPLDFTQLRWEKKTPRTNLYLVHPRREVYVPNGTVRNGLMLGVIWEHDYDEGWDVFVDHWPSHLVRRPRAREEEVRADAEGGPVEERKGRRATVEDADEDETTC